jgi:ribulose-phosphate 3-epimerase
MTHIIPAINVNDFSEVERRVRLAEHHVEWVHIDVADGTFTPHAVWHDARDLKNFTTPLKIEIHFMVKNPEAKIAEWFLPAVSRIIFHEEATHEAHSLIENCHKASKEVGVAIRLDTLWEALIPYSKTADIIQTLAVHPGPSGQIFDPATLEKIKHLRAAAPDAMIEVDGGLGAQGIARECVRAGADALVVGESLFEGSCGFAEALQALQKNIGEAS